MNASSFNKLGKLNKLFYLFSVVLFLAIDATSLTAGSHSIAYRSLKLAPAQAKALLDNGPYHSMEVEESGKIWVSNHQNLWRWDVSNGKLSKILMGSNSQKCKIEDLKKIGNNLYVVCGQSLTKIALSSLARTTYRFKTPIKVIKRKKDHSKQAVVLIGNKTIANIHAESDSVSKSKIINEEIAKQINNNILILDHFWIYSVAGKLVVYDDLKHNIVRKIDFSHEIIDVLSKYEKIIVYTKYSVFILDKTFDVEKSIPVFPQRQLKRMVVSDGYQSYLFSDGTIEFYQLHELQKYFVTLSELEVDKVTSFRQTGNYIGIIENGIPFAYQLESNHLNLANYKKLHKKYGL